MTPAGIVVLHEPVDGCPPCAVSCALTGVANSIMEAVSRTIIMVAVAFVFMLRCIFLCSIIFLN